MVERELISFAGKKMNSDDDIDLIPLGDSRPEGRNDIVYPTGDINVIENRRVLTLITHTLPSGTNTIHGRCTDIEHNAVIYFVCNSANNDCIIRFYTDNTFQNISYSQDWQFDVNYPIYDAGIIGSGDDALLWFNDALNTPRCVHIKNLIDGDYTTLDYTNSHLLKPAPIYKPTLLLGTDEDYIGNNIRGQRRQFAYSYLYDNEMESTVSHWSDVLYDYANEYPNGDFDNNYQLGNKININLYCDISSVVKLKLYVRSMDLGSGFAGSWGLYDTLDLTDTLYYSNIYHYTFYNDKSSITVDQSIFNLLYDDIPLTAGVMKSIDRDRILLGELNRKYSNVDIDIDLESEAENFVPDILTLYTTGAYDVPAVAVQIDVKGYIGYKTQYELTLVKMKLSTNAIDSYENYVYQGDAEVPWGATYQNNIAIVQYFVDTINAKSEFNVTAYNITGGGTPNLLNVTNNSGSGDGFYYGATILSSPILDFLDRRLSFKENSTVKLAICYYDNYNRSGKSLIKDLEVKIPHTGNLTANTSQQYLYKIKYTINHLAPDWAVCYQFMYGGSNITQYFSVPILFHTIQGQTTHITRRISTTKIDITEKYRLLAELQQTIQRDIHALGFRVEYSYGALNEDYDKLAYLTRIMSPEQKILLAKALEQGLITPTLAENTSAGLNALENYLNSQIVKDVTSTVLSTITTEERTDVINDTDHTIIDLNAAMQRCYDDNQKVNLNYFNVKKGDRVRVLGYAQVDKTAQLKPTFKIFKIYEYVDVEIIDIDNDGKVIVPLLSGDYTTGTCILEFYRKGLNVDIENLFYFEIGDVLTIDENGWHQGGTQSQTESVPATGYINFGDTYRFNYHFTNYFINSNTAPTLYEFYPIMANIESQSSSFMYPSRALSTGRANWYEENYKNETQHALIYGGLLRKGDLNYIDINRFASNPEFMEERYGKIIGIEQKGKTLHIYQEKKITTISLNAIETTLPDGSTQMVYSPKVLGQVKPLPYEFGCSHIGSIANNLYATYHFDVLTSAWYRFSQDGVKDITTSAKMKTYALALSKVITTAMKSGGYYKITSDYDPVKELYIFSFKSSDPSEKVTIAFHEPTNAWLSPYTFYPDCYFSMNENRFFSFHSGQIYEHHISTTRVATGYIQLHFNKFPADVKIFRNMELDSEQIWCPSTEGDISINDDAVGYQNTTSKERFFTRMTSLLKEVHFDYYEGRWKARFRGNMLNKKGVSTGKVGFLNGELLRGRTLSVKLRNTKTDFNPLKVVTIGYEKSK